MTHGGNVWPGAISGAQATRRQYSRWRRRAARIPGEEDTETNRTGE